MSLNQFEEAGKRILDSKLHLAVRDNTSVIDRNFVNEYQNYTLQSLQDVKFRDVNEIESTEDIDIRVKKVNELEKRFLVTMCDLKKQSKLTEEQCMLHKRSEEPLSDRYLKTFLDNVSFPMDIEQIVLKDSIAIAEHAANIAKVKKLCEDLMIKDMEKKRKELHSSLSPALQVADQVTTLLSEMDDDIDCLSNAKKMYDGLSTSSGLVNSNWDQLKKLKDIL